MGTRRSAPWSSSPFLRLARLRGPGDAAAGPFLAYDRQGKLVSSIYMIPLKDMNAQKAFAGLKTGQGEQVDHVDVVYNAGHPGVAESHYHIVLWYISAAKAAALK